ncbi:MAG: hypothetical protein SNJ68_07195 [Cyanobacteriota bacterium]
MDQLPTLTGGFFSVQAPIRDPVSFRDPYFCLKTLKTHEQHQGCQQGICGLCKDYARLSDLDA